MVFDRARALDGRLEDLAHQTYRPLAHEHGATRTRQERRGDRDEDLARRSPRARRDEALVDDVQDGDRRRVLLHALSRWRMQLGVGAELLEAREVVVGRDLQMRVAEAAPG